MTPSIGASARPLMIEAAIIMPPVSLPSRASEAPQPSIRIWVERRTNFDTPAMTMLRSWPVTWAFSDSPVSRPQIITLSGIMPMALMTWLLRAMASDWMFARVE